MAVTSVVTATDVAKIEFAAEKTGSYIYEIHGNETWEEMFWTLKNSCSLTQSQGDKTEINVDQREAAVDVKYGSGTFEGAMQIPSLDTNVCQLFFNTDTVPAKVGYTGVGVNTTRKVLGRMMKITYTNETEVIITNTQLVGTFSKSGDGAFIVDVAVTALASTVAANEDIIIYNKD